MTWMADAPCVGQPDLFYVDVGNTIFDEAAALCSTCPVFDECEADRRAYEQHPVNIHGFRAGRTAEERKKEWRARHGRAPRFEDHERRGAVALLVEGGYSERQIAVQLGINQRSVSRIKAQLRAQTVAA